MLDDHSLLIVLHQMIYLQVSSDTMILIYNQQIECIDGSTDKGVCVQTGGLSSQLIYKTQLVLIPIYIPH